MSWTKDFTHRLELAVETQRVDAWRRAAEAWEQAYNGALQAKDVTGDARGLARLRSHAMRMTRRARKLGRELNE